MKKYTLKTYSKKLLADTLTPVSVYLRLRDSFPNSLLLESSDYHANDNSFSYICCNPIASIEVKNETLTQSFPDGTESKSEIAKPQDVIQTLQEFSQSFTLMEPQKLPFVHHGLFGFMSYDMVRYFESIDLKKKQQTVIILFQ